MQRFFNFIFVLQNSTFAENDKFLFINPFLFVILIDHLKFYIRVLSKLSDCHQSQKTRKIKILCTASPFKTKTVRNSDRQRKVFLHLKPFEFGWDFLTFLKGIRFHCFNQIYWIMNFWKNGFFRISTAILKFFPKSKIPPSAKIKTFFLLTHFFL